MDDKRPSAFPVAISGDSPACDPPDSANRRHSLRTPVNYRSLCRISSVSYVVDVYDVSRSGARIAVRQGLMPAIGQAVSLLLMERDAIEAHVVWCTGTHAGLHFLEPLADRDDALFFDDLGAAYFKAILKFQLVDA